MKFLLPEMDNDVPANLRPAYVVNRLWLERCGREAREPVEKAHYGMLDLQLRTAGDWLRGDSSPAAADHLRSLEKCREKLGTLYRRRLDNENAGKIGGAFLALQAALDNAEATLARWAFREQHETYRTVLAVNSGTGRRRAA